MLSNTATSRQSAPPLAFVIVLGGCVIASLGSLAQLVSVSPVWEVLSARAVGGAMTCP
jgi:hypothetical protein